MIKKWKIDTNSGEEGFTPNSEGDGQQRPGNVNRILKGSSIKGDIRLLSDLELTGELDGNVTSERDSNITIKGLCKGNIETRGGSVHIEGEMQGGNIIAGKDVTISGCFCGGDIKAGARLYIDGEVSGKLEGNIVEVGAKAQVRGELRYREFIAIAKGAKVEGHLLRLVAEAAVEKAEEEGGFSLSEEESRPSEAKVAAG